MEVAGAPIWSQSFDQKLKEVSQRFSEKMEESRKRIVDNLQRNLEKRFDEVFSRIRGELSLIREELKEEESELSDEKTLATIDLPRGDVEIMLEEPADMKMSSCEQYFCSADGLVGGCSDAVAVMLVGGVVRSEIWFSDAKTSRSVSEFVFGSRRGGEFLGGHKIAGEIGCGVEGFARKIRYVGRLGDFGDGFTGGGHDIFGELGGRYIGQAGGFYRHFEGVMAMEKPSIAGEEIAGQTTICGGQTGKECDLANWRSDASGSGGLVYFSLGGCFVTGNCCGGGNGLRSWEKELQILPEDENENGRSFGSVVGLEKKTQIEYACKGILVISLEAIVVDYYLMGHVLLRKASRLQTNSNPNNGLLSCMGPYLHYSLSFLTRGDTDIGIWTCGLKLYWYILVPKVVPSPTNEELQHRWKPGIGRKGFTVQLCQGREYLANYHPP